MVEQSSMILTALHLYKALSDLQIAHTMQTDSLRCYLQTILDSFRVIHLFGHVVENFVLPKRKKGKTKRTKNKQTNKYYDISAYLL